MQNLNLQRYCLARGGWHEFKLGMFIRRKAGEQAYYRIQQWKNSDHINILQVSGEFLGYVVMIDIDMLHENFTPAEEGYESDFFKLWDNLNE